MATRTVSIPAAPVITFSLATACSTLASELKPLMPANLKAVLLALDSFFAEVREINNDDRFDLYAISEEVKCLLAYHRVAIGETKVFNAFCGDLAAVLEAGICFLNENLDDDGPVSKAQAELYRIGQSLGFDVFSGNYFGQKLRIPISTDPIKFFFENSTIEEIIQTWNESRMDEAERLQLSEGKVN